MGGTEVARVIAAGTITVMLYAATPAFATSTNDRLQCNKGPAGDTRIAACTRLISLGLKRGELVAVIHNRAVGYQEKNEYDRAIVDFNESLRLDPRHVLSLFGRGSVYRDKLEYQLAVADLSAAIRINPRMAEAIAARGFIYRDMREFQRAIAEFSEAIRIKPKLAWAFIGRGISYRLAGDGERALADIERGIKLDPKDSFYPAARGIYHYLGGAGYNAIADFNESLRLDSKYNADAFYGRSVARLAKGDTAGGNADISAAQSRDASIAELWMRRYGIGPGAAVRQGQSTALSRDSQAAAGSNVESASTAGADCSDAALHWKSAEDVKSLTIYEDHLKHFADCAFAAIARARIEAMKK